MNTYLILAIAGIGIVAVVILLLQQKNKIFNPLGFFNASRSYLDSYDRDELREMARREGLSPSGSKQQLINKIERKRSENLPDERINLDLDNDGTVEQQERALQPQKVNQSYKYDNGRKILDRVTVTAKPIVQAPRSMFHKLEAPFSLLRRNKAPEAKFRNLHPRGSVIVANEKEGDYETTIGSKNTFQIREAKAIQKSDSELVIKGTTKGGQPFAVYGKVNSIPKEKKK